MWLFLVAAVVLAQSVGQTPDDQHARSLSYGTTLTISGVVTFEDHFGPPNYGENPETDAHETAYILNLATPIDVIANPVNADDVNSDGFRNVRRIQMATSPALAKRIAERHWKPISVTGKLFERHTGHHLTDVLIAVDSIRSP